MNSYVHDFDLIPVFLVPGFGHMLENNGHYTEGTDTILGGDGQYSRGETDSIKDCKGGTDTLTGGTDTLQGGTETIQKGEGQ